MKSKKALLFIFIFITFIIGLGIGTLVTFNILTNNYNYQGTTVEGYPDGVYKLNVTELTPQTEGKKAAIQTNEEYIEYDTVKEAYEDANFIYLNVNTTLIFFDDWIVEGESGFGEYNVSTLINHGYGYGGSIAPHHRTTTLTINLNGHTLGRVIENPMEDGSVVCIRNFGTFVFENGYITGGNTSGNGGGVYIEYVGDKTSVEFYNMHISNNHAEGKGGGIFTSYQDSRYAKDNETSVYIINSSIYNNTAKESGGGMYCDVLEGFSYTPQIYLRSIVVIYGNTCSNSKKHNNLTLCRTTHCIKRIKELLNLTSGSKIYISWSDNTSESENFVEMETDKTLFENVDDFFHTDDSDRKIKINQYDTYYALEICKKKSGC